MRINIQNKQQLNELLSDIHSRLSVVEDEVFLKERIPLRERIMDEVEPNVFYSTRDIMTMFPDDRESTVRVTLYRLKEDGVLYRNAEKKWYR